MIRRHRQSRSLNDRDAASHFPTLPSPVVRFCFVYRYPSMRRSSVLRAAVHVLPQTLGHIFKMSATLCESMPRVFPKEGLDLKRWHAIGKSIRDFESQRLALSHW